MMRKEEKELIQKLIDNELSEEEKERVNSFLNQNEEAYEYYKKMEILRNSLKEIKNLRERIYLKDKILIKIKKEKTKRRFLLSLGFALTFSILILFFIPFNQTEKTIKISNLTKPNHKYIISNIAFNSNIKEIEITLYVKGEKIEEKTGNLRIPKEEFNYLYETLNEKGDLVLEKVEGSQEKVDYINIKINYKNYPEKSFGYYLGLILPYIIISIIFLVPLFIILKRKKNLI
ncbi:MAG: hypothetical protein H5U37_04400 [Caldisericia bacterium]|nr:hypothetical protein [Caldisericia bacterium]